MEKRYDYITPDDFETAKLNGITKTALEQRVYSYNWDVDRATTEPMRVTKSFQSVWDEWGELATKNGISRSVFYHRVKTSLWSEEKAAKTKLMRGGRKSTFTDEEREIAMRNGVHYNSMSIVRGRINLLGWSREKALNTPVISEEERLKRVVAGTRKYQEERGVNRGFNKKNRAVGN